MSFKSVLNSAESNRWLKIYMWFSGLTIGNYKGFICHTSWGKDAFPYQTWFIVSALKSLKVVLVQDSGPPAHHALHMFGFLLLAPSFLGLFIWGLGMISSSGTPAEVGGKGEGTIWRHFYSLWLAPNPFPLPAFLPPHTLVPRVHKTEEDFVQGPLNSLYWLTLNQHTIL